MQTKLGTIISNMDSFQTIQTIDQRTKVQYIDLANKNDSSGYKLPFRLKKISLRVFPGITHYALPDDYDELSYVDNDGKEYQDRARFKFQSYNEFEEDKDYRNDLAEIYEDGEVYLGCRYKADRATSTLVDSAESVLNYAASGDASNLALDNVFYKDGNASVRFSIVMASNTAMIENTFTLFSDALYQRKYLFRVVYLSGQPSSIALRFGNDSSNYLYQANITTQFDGTPLKANAWNLIAFDLNTALTIGTVNTNTFSYVAIIFTNAPSGLYYLDNIDLRQWELLENFNYFSKNAVKTLTGVAKETFIDPSTETYDITDGLVGPIEWANFIMYRAMILALGDKTDDPLYVKVAGVNGKGGWSGEAEMKLKNRFPMVRQNITNSNWNFKNNLMSGYGTNFNRKD